MSKNRRLIRLLFVLSLIMVFALAACGGDDEDDDKKPAATKPPTSAPTAEATAEEVVPTAEATAEEVVPTAEATAEEVVPTAEATAEEVVPTAEVAATVEATAEVAATVEATAEVVALAPEATEEAAATAEAEVEATAEAAATAEVAAAGTEEAGTDIISVLTADGRFTMLMSVAAMAGPDLPLTSEGPFTFFAPTDEALTAIMTEQADLTNALMADPTAISNVMLYHVIPGLLTAEDIAAAETLTTANEKEIAVMVDADGAVVLNGTVKVIESGIEASNGIIYVLDGVLLPPDLVPAAAATEEAPVAEATAEAVAMATEEAAATEEAPVAEATEAPAEEEIVVPAIIDCDQYDLSNLKIGLVTDVGQINDKSFNQSSWQGVLAAGECGAEIDYIETQDAADYAKNIAEFAENDYDIIVTVGYALGTATLEAAATYPEITFIGVDQSQGEAVDNVVGLVFHEDQSGYLAGVLAARLTQTNIIAAVLGTDSVPPVVAFKEGFEAGARAVNPDITIYSTYHPGSIDQAFSDPEWGAQTARQALDLGADVIFGAGGKTGNGALIEIANAVTEAGQPPFCIGVDSDQWGTLPEAHSCLVSSAMKLLDKGVATIIMSIADGTVPAGNFFGEAALADFHDLAVAVPEEVKTELIETAAGLASGEISTGYGTATEEPAEAAATEEAAAATSDLGVVKVGLNAEYPPFEFVDESGNIVGFDVSLMDAIAAEAGFEIEWINTRFDTIFVALQSGEFDAVSSAATITEEREEMVDFSNPYFNAGQMIAVREADATSVTTTDDLAGLRVGVQSGTTGDLAATEMDGVTVVRYDEITLAFQALANGDIDAIVNDGPTSNDIISKNPDMGVVLVGDPFTDEFYGIAVNSDKPELLDAINTALAAIIANGTYEQIYLEWFGVEPPSMFMPQ